MTESRDTSLDFMKGIAIFFVVLGHVVINVFDKENFIRNPVFKITYSIHMPVLFYVSGFIAGIKGKNYVNTDFLLKRSKRLLLPNIIWTLVYCVYIKQPDVISVLFNYTLYWFFFVLWIFSLFLYLALKSKKPIFIILCEFLLLFTLFVVFNENNNLVIRNSFFYFPVFFAAYYIETNKNKMNVSLINKILNLSIILYPLSLFFYSYGTEPEVYSRIIIFFNRQNSKILKAVIMLCIYFYNYCIVGGLGICFLWKISKVIVNLNNKKQGFLYFVERFFCLLSLYSIQIYIFNRYFMLAYTGNRYADSIMALIISICFSVTVGWLSKKIRWLSVFLFGQ